MGSIIVLIAAVFMLWATNLSKEAQYASFFIIFLEIITAFNNCCGLYYFNYLMLFYCCISALFAVLALKSSFMSDNAYTVYAWAYIFIGFEDTLYEFGYIIVEGFLNRNYEFFMYGCLAFLVFSVTHDRMAYNTRRVGISML